jgi:hypothetical protein
VNNQNLRVKTALLSFREQQLLVSVFAVVCAALDVCVTHAGYSNELWRFSTSTRVWERVDTPATNRPSGRGGHTMTSVGQDLWVFGGLVRGESGSSDESDTCTTRVVLCDS